MASRNLSEKNHPEHKYSVTFASKVGTIAKKSEKNRVTTIIRHMTHFLVDQIDFPSSRKALKRPYWAKTSKKGFENFSQNLEFFGAISPLKFSIYWRQGPHQKIFRVRH